MTEAEWLAATDKSPMFGFLEHKANERKVRLFACACARHIRHLLLTDLCRFALDVAERHADGLATAEELWTAGTTAEDSLSLADYGEYSRLPRILFRLGTHGARGQFLGNCLWVI